MSDLFYVDSHGYNLKAFKRDQELLVMYYYSKLNTFFDIERQIFLNSSD